LYVKQDRRAQLEQQHTPDFTLGYALGVRAAKRSPGLNDAMLAAKAQIAYGRASRTHVLDKDEFLRGYILAYQQRREPTQQ
jgi:hypothetical protein